MPFITLRRSEPPKYGTNANVKYRIAQYKKFTYVKVPTFDNGIHGMEIYKIPQPIPLDLMYEIPSQKNPPKTFTVTLDYAIQKLSKVNLGSLMAA